VKRVLIVDDDPITRDVLRKSLDDAGYTTACAGNGWEGLLALDGERADLVILDVMMPGMDGPTFLKIVRNGARLREVPVIVISAYNIADVRDALNGCNIAAFLSKSDVKYFDRLLAETSRILGGEKLQEAN
jgi:two-component system response regulator MprA